MNKFFNSVQTCIIPFSLWIPIYLELYTNVIYFIFYLKSLLLITLSPILYQNMHKSEIYILENVYYFKFLRVSKISFGFVRQVYFPQFCLITTKIWSDGH